MVLSHARFMMTTIMMRMIKALVLLKLGWLTVKLQIISLQKQIQDEVKRRALDHRKIKLFLEKFQARLSSQFGREKI